MDKLPELALGEADQSDCVVVNSSLAFIKEGTEQQSIPSGFARKALTLQVLSKCLLKIEPKQTDLNSRKKTLRN